ncbi:MAG: hypothetical protein M2R45_04869 [Verrucomicrobia subdivision 3 bacterium]|nr:hypothetical protein [Limisphaerales bacterium]MCS1417524.1 hypothetical protein [Limisphaerales bacterium]
MWYVMTDQNLRWRLGVCTVLECVIAFENVQNIAIRRGSNQCFLAFYHCR